MIYVTGDTHGRVRNDRDSKKLFNPTTLPSCFTNKQDKSNYLIVTGDLGAIWSKESLQENINYFSQFNGTILFCDGNNDNIEMLEAMPVEEWHGGKVHKISPNMIHLMRGECFEIENKTFFVFGGADSWDRPIKANDKYIQVYSRAYGVNWWPQEQPTKEEFNHAMETLKAHHFKVDFIISHDAPTMDIKKYLDWNKIEPTNEYLQQIEDKTNYRHWFFGHHHMDSKMTKHRSCIFSRFENIDDQKFEQFKDNDIKQIKNDEGMAN